MLPISKGLLGMPKHGLVQRAFASNGRLLNLNEISNIDGATKLRKRWGRGTGSGRGKLCGFGHQKSRSTPRGFEGGQTPLYKRLPKIGFHNPNHIDYEVVNLEKLQQFIDMGRLKVAENSWVTTRDLLACGLISRLRDGVKILANGKEQFKTPIHLEVSSASREAIRAVEAAGGSVTAVHFNALALRAVAKPYKFDLLPGRARPPPKRMGYYLDRNRAGYLSPEVQTRNLKLFGAISSEEMYQKQHQAFMEQKRRSKQ